MHLVGKTILLTMISSGMCLGCSQSKPEPQPSETTEETAKVPKETIRLIELYSIAEAHQGRLDADDATLHEIAKITGQNVIFIGDNSYIVDEEKFSGIIDTPDPCARRIEALSNQNKLLKKDNTIFIDENDIPQSCKAYVERLTVLYGGSVQLLKNDELE